MEKIAKFIQTYFRTKSLPDYFKRRKVQNRQSKQLKKRQPNRQNIRKHHRTLNASKIQQLSQKKLVRPVTSKKTYI